MRPDHRNRPDRPPSPIKLKSEDDQLMRDMIAKRLGSTGYKLRATLGVPTAECTVCRRPKKRGWTL
ncbi:MAG: hypothetical protein AAGG38_14655 [Planctomycetota bacterium]